MRIVMALGGNALLRGDPRQWPAGRALGASGRGLSRRAPYPLDVLGAESEGMIGYLVDLALGDALPDRDIATLLTQVEVAPDDPAFCAPSKPVGPTYSSAEVEYLSARTYGAMIRDGLGWWRAVPSPASQLIREINTVKLLSDAGVIVVCAGGGGIPVIRTNQDGFQGAEAVIDKDCAAALLAESVEAD